MKLLIIEDDNSLREIMQRALTTEGYVVETASTFFEAEDKIAGYEYDCIMLDIMLPDGNGLKLLEHIKSLGKNDRVIIISARDSLDDKIEGLNLGADDYIMKPYTIRNVIARVKSVLRRTTTHKSNNIHSDKANILQVDGLRLDLEFKRCTVDGEEVKLARKEFELLAYLISHRGKILSREQILGKIWKEEVVVLDRTIDVNITRVRSKIGAYGSYIVTRSGFGYGFRD